MTYTEWNAGANGQPYPPPGGANGQPFSPQPQQKSGLRKVLGVAGSVVILGGIALARFTGFFGAGDPEVGDCIQPDAESWVVADCDSDEAQYKVVGIEEEQVTEAEFEADQDLCAGFPATQYVLWSGVEGADGTVFCAGPV